MYSRKAAKYKEGLLNEGRAAAHGPAASGLATAAEVEAAHTAQTAQFRKQVAEQRAQIEQLFAERNQLRDQLDQALELRLTSAQSRSKSRSVSPIRLPERGLGDTGSSAALEHSHSALRAATNWADVSDVKLVPVDADPPVIDSATTTAPSSPHNLSVHRTCFSELNYGS